MRRRILLFGATGFTGGLTAAALLAGGTRPVLVGRNAKALASKAAELDADRALETITVDVRDVAALRRTITSDDVVITTVGPFCDLGRPVAEAAAEAGASYLDSTGESPFIRWVFEKLDARAQARGARLIPAFGYDYVPGQLAGALALQKASDVGRPHRLEIGYFTSGGARNGFSAGTLSSLAGVGLEPTYTFRDGIRTERVGARTARFTIDGHGRSGLSVGASEHFVLPELAPGLSELDVYLGWFGKLTPLLSAISVFAPVIGVLPGAKRAVAAIGSAVAGLGSGSPSAESIDNGRSLIAARVSDGHDEVLSEVSLVGPSPYSLTAELLAWAATVESGAASGRQSGALGAVSAFGLEGLRRGCAQIGLVEHESSVRQ